MLISIYGMFSNSHLEKIPFIVEVYWFKGKLEVCLLINLSHPNQPYKRV